MSLHKLSCGCERCAAAASVPADQVEAKLSALAGAPVRFCQDRLPYCPRMGMVFEGATSALARLCGFKHPNGRCYLTGPKVLWLLSVAP